MSGFYSNVPFPPPEGTAHVWGPKALDRASWTCRTWAYGGVSITCEVDLVRDLDPTRKELETKFRWTVAVVGWNGLRFVLTGLRGWALDACLMAEEVAREEKAKLWKPWMEDALRAGWRPPT